YRQSVSVVRAAGRLGPQLQRVFAVARCGRVRGRERSGVVRRGASLRFHQRRAGDCGPRAGDPDRTSPELGVRGVHRDEPGASAAARRSHVHGTVHGDALSALHLARPEDALRDAVDRARVCDAAEPGCGAFLHLASAVLAASVPFVRRIPHATVGRMRRRALVVTFFVAMALINTYPLILHPGSTIGEHGDAYFSVWRLAWVAHQLRADPWHLFDANIYYPHHDTLAYSDAMILPGVALAPLHWMGLDALVIYNLTLIAAFAASGVCAYVLVRELTGSTAAGVLGGVIFAFSAHRLEHFNHLELQFAFWIPLAVLAWHR